MNDAFAYNLSALPPGGVSCQHTAEGPRVNIPHAHKVHSPSGFDWGYGGSGPADLALNILALCCAWPDAKRLYQDFKHSVIARLAQSGGALITTERIGEWLDSRGGRETN